MKKVLAMVLISAMTMGLFSGCGNKEVASSEASASSEAATESAAEESNADDNAGITIGFSADYLSDFMSYVVAGVKQAGDDLGVEITVQDAEWDTAKQLQQVENFIMAGVDAVILKPCDSANCQPVVDACAEAGIPFVCVNNDSEAGCECYVGSDHYYSGQLQAEYLNEACPDGGEIGILMGELVVSATSERCAGLKENLNENFKVYSEQDCGWMRDEGMNTMENWISAGADLVAVCGNNDEMAIGAAKVLKENNISNVLVCGIDASEDALEMIKSGDMAMTVFQNGYMQGYRGVEAAVKLIKGETVEEYIDVPYELVTIDNVAEYEEFYASVG